MSSGQRSDKWEKIPLDKNLVQNALNLARRDLKTSGDVLKNGDFDWAYSISYNAMLQAGRALMFNDGYRPAGEYKHVSVIEYVKERFNKDFAGKILFMFNKIRKKRHLVVYEQVNVITQEEAKNAQQIAKEFVEKVDDLIRKR